MINKSEQPSLRETGGNLILDPPKGPYARLTNPNPNYCKSKEGIEEYKKVGLPYPDNHHDKHYQDFLERTPAGRGNDYTHKNKTRVSDIYRYRLTPEKEYLVWNQTETRYSPLDNPERVTKTNLGRYPIVEMKNVMQVEESGYKHVVTEPTGHTKTGYSLPYTLKNIDNLHKNASDDYEFEEATGKDMRPTHYHLYDARKRNTIAIHSWEDFRDGDFDELYQYSKKVSSDQEAQAIKDEQEKERQQVEEQKLDQLKRSVR